MRPQPGFVPHVMELGGGPRRALALHCTMGFGGAWTGFAKQTSDAVTLVAPDMPSHGLSPDWDEESDFADTVYMASVGAMDDAPMDVIGHSFGAVTALRIAALNPHRVRSLTVIEPVFFAAALRIDSGALGNYHADAAPFTAAIAEGDVEQAARAFNRMWGDTGPKWDTLPVRTRAAMTRAIHVVPGTQDFLFDDSRGLLAPGALDAVSVPTVLMRGQDAHQAIVATNNALEDVIPGATQAVIEGAGHMAPVSHPAPSAAVVRDLLARS